MAKRRPGLGWQDHRALGLELSGLHQRLCKLTCHLDAKVSRKAANLCRRVDDALGRLRDEMDREVFAAFPERDTETLARVYYGAVSDGDVSRLMQRMLSAADSADTEEQK